MARYTVTFSQYSVYNVEASDEDEAEDIAYEMFKADMRVPIARTYYDEVEIECDEEEEDDEEFYDDEDEEEVD